MPDFGVDIAGETGAQAVSTDDGARSRATGQVYLDAIKAMRMRRHGIARVAQEVVEHELGHRVGLVHRTAQTASRCSIGELSGDGVTVRLLDQIEHRVRPG